MELNNVTLANRVKALAELRKKLISLTEDDKSSIAYACLVENPWFSKYSVFSAIDGIVNLLEEESIQAFLKKYTIPESDLRPVGIIMAGNLPGVGFHDWLMVFLSGRPMRFKAATIDGALIRTITQYIYDINADFRDWIKEVPQLKLDDVDAVIATGSDNSNRYFSTYFKDKPHLLRGHRNSCAVLSGKESDEELIKLGKDVFTYFGLGCRSVSLICIPNDFSIEHVLDLWQQFDYVIENNKYANNYLYHKAAFLVNKQKHLDTGYVLLKESDVLTSQISVIHYMRYESMDEITKFIEDQASRIQCIATNMDLETSSVPVVGLGTTQSPGIGDFADGVDTMQFLLN